MMNDLKPLKESLENEECLIDDDMEENEVLEEDDFLQNYFTYGIVLRGDFKEIQKLKKTISKHFYNLEVKYQKISTNPLYIKED